MVPMPITAPLTIAPSVLIRAARGSDGPALVRLAALDSAALPQGELLVAESDGAIVAARAIGTGETIADPFRPTADLVALLTLRSRLVERPDRARHAHGRASWFGLRGGRVVSHSA
jgi:hypothetical protein